MNEKNQEEANTGGDERGGEEVEDGPEGDHAAHLGIEAGGARDQACNYKGEDHQLEQPHEELPGVVDQDDGLLAGVEKSEGQAQGDA